MMRLQLSLKSWCWHMIMMIITMSSYFLIIITMVITFKVVISISTSIVTSVTISVPLLLVWGPMHHHYLLLLVQASSHRQYLPSSYDASSISIIKSILSIVHIHHNNFCYSDYWFCSSIWWGYSCPWIMMLIYACCIYKVQQLEQFSSYIYHRPTVLLLSL